MDNIFGYTQSDNVKVNTQPVMVNQKVDMRGAKAFQDISNILQTGVKAYGNYQENKQKNSLVEASNEANEVHKWYNEQIATTTDPYKQNEILNQYTTALDSIETGYELEDKYKNTFVNSNKAFRGEQERVIGKKVLAKQIEDTDVGIGNLASSLAGASSSEIANVMKDATTAYMNLGLSKEQASDKIFATVINKKVEAFNADPLYSDFSKLEADVEEFVKVFDPKLKNKELDIKYKDLVKSLKEEQKGLAKAHLETFLKSEKVTQSLFESEADKLSHALSDLELSNLKEAKANNVYSLKITRKARAQAELSSINDVFRRDLKAVLVDPEASEKTIKTYLEKAQEIDGMTKVEATSKFNVWKQKRAENTLKTKSAAQKKEEKALKEEATRVVRDIKSKPTTKEGMSPNMLEGYIALKNGGVVSTEDQKFYDKYKFKWDIENSANKLTTTIDRTSTSYVGTGAEEEAIKEVMGTTINSFYKNNESFSADGILKIYRNHDVKGNVASFISKDLNTPQSAVGAIQKVKAMKDIDDIAVQKLLGDKLYYQVSALESRITQDKDGNPIIMPNDLRDVNKLVNDPEAIPVDTSVFNEALKENLHLYKYKSEFKYGVALTGDAETVLENIEAKIKQEFPTEGVQLTGYKGINLSEDDIEIIADLKKAFQRENPNTTGFAYNPANDTFYFSAVGATYYSPITRKTEDGTEVAVNKINGPYGVINVLSDKMTETYLSRGDKTLLELAANPVDTISKFSGDFTDVSIDTEAFSKTTLGILSRKLGEYSDKLLSLNPKSGGEPLIDITEKAKELWQRVKDGSSGLQGAELETVQTPTYEQKIDKLKKEKPVESNKEATSMIKALTSIKGNKKEVEDLQKTMGITVDGDFGEQTSKAILSKLTEKYHVFKNSTEAKNAGKYVSGEQAVKKLQEYSDTPLPEKYKNIAREEGFVDGLYKDDVGVVTFGLGQTQEHIFKNPIDTIKEHEDTLKKTFKNYNKLDDKLQEELLSIVYRGDFKSGMKWVSEFKKGNYYNAALNLLDHEEYYGRQNEKGLDGVEKRLEKAAKTFIAYDFNLDKKTHSKLIDSLLKDIKLANKLRK